MLRVNADEEGLTAAVSILDSGGLVAYPTDTLYGLGADALDEDAVARVFVAKERPEGVALPVLVAGVDHVRHVARLTPLARRLAAEHWPGALTLVLPALPTVAENLLGGKDTVAVRVPDAPWALALAEHFGPVTATSANRHGEPAARTARECETVAGVDCLVDGGALPGTPSTIVDATGAEPKVLRQGAVALK